MCTRHTAKLMTSKATSSCPESRLAPSFNNGLRQLLLLQEKSASNPLFQGRQEHRSNVRGTLRQRRPKSISRRALAIPLLDHLATQKDYCLDQLKDALQFYRLRSPTLYSSNSCNLHYTTRLKLWLNANMISIPTLTSCYESSAR